ncbi:MAG TPA: imidazolonepropionase [Acidimicrobiales bacterium]|jgi:imidazolonepropionase|nr:imidazolonepropionase [Acidimicrobiales bacterium]
MGDVTVVRAIGRLATCGAAGTLEDAAVAFDQSSILYAGSEAGLLEAGGAGGWLDGADEHDAGGRLLTPGLVDAHTHPLYGGNRFAEIALRSTGASYAELAAAGGGIASSVAATRATPHTELEAAARHRLAKWLGGGATTVEAKSGYHLDEAGEASDVAILASLSGAPGLPSIEVTWLAGHAVAPEFADADAYIDAATTWCGRARAAGARHADVFCDAGYFTVEQGRRLLGAAAAAGLIPRIHADELDRTGGALLAAELGCASADHLLKVNQADAKALAAAGVVATLAPVTALAMGVRPPVAWLQEAGVTIALGSDHNPGTCGTTSMSLVVALAVAELGLSVDGALAAATAGGAASLRLADRGRLEPGLRPDLVLWEADHEGAFAWGYGLQPRQVWIGGRPAA